MNWWVCRKEEFRHWTIDTSDSSCMMYQITDDIKKSKKMKSNLKDEPNTECPKSWEFMSKTDKTRIQYIWFRSTWRSLIVLQNDAEWSNESQHDSQNQSNSQRRSMMTDWIIRGNTWDVWRLRVVRNYFMKVRFRSNDFVSENFQRAVHDTTVENQSHRHW